MVGVHRVLSRLRGHLRELAYPEGVPPGPRVLGSGPPWRRLVLRADSALTLSSESLRHGRA